jgi:hypothetical protein
MKTLNTGNHRTINYRPITKRKTRIALVMVMYPVLMLIPGYSLTKQLVMLIYTF